MKVLRMRQKLAVNGLVLLQHGEGFKVTDNGVKTPIDIDFPNLAAVDKWFKETHTNRLTEAESDEFDKDWAKFVIKENGGTYGTRSNDSE